MRGDKNNDGKLSPEEIPPQIKDRFDRSSQEFQQVHQVALVLARAVDPRLDQLAVLLERQPEELLKEPAPLTWNMKTQLQTRKL